MNRIGGAERDRTADLLVANEALSQLSYSPRIGGPRKLTQDPRRCGQPLRVYQMRLLARAPCCYLSTGGKRLFDDVPDQSCGIRFYAQKRKDQLDSARGLRLDLTRVTGLELCVIKRNPPE